ncbi:hypothetical protein GCM10011362_05480 [Marinobacter halophilus]|nr:hypothetical protein GCM10011362_05480 [Marinobacter halophilus]
MSQTARDDSMTQRSPVHSPAGQAQLIQLLARAGAKVDGDPLPCFGERLGRLFGLGDTMTLDAAIAFRSRQPGMDQAVVFDRLTQELATTRRALISKINGFSDEFESTQTESVEPWLNAWLLLQRKLAATSRQLRDKVRKAMQNHNQILARLAELDAVFDHTMAGYTSQCFAHIPKVLEQRFQTLQTPSEHTQEPGTQPGDWLHRYCEEAQTLLLAELDVRLEPVLGLLEACHNEVSNTP